MSMWRESLEIRLHTYVLQQHLFQVKFLKELSEQEDLSGVMNKLTCVAAEVLDCGSLRFVQRHQVLCLVECTNMVVHQLLYQLFPCAMMFVFLSYHPCLHREYNDLNVAHCSTLLATRYFLNLFYIGVQSMLARHLCLECMEQWIHLCNHCQGNMLICQVWLR